MRLIELSTFHERCGVATYTEALADGLSKLGVEVSVLSPHLEQGGQERGVSPPRLWGRHDATILEALRTFTAIRELRPDVVHAQVNLGLFSPRFLAVIGTLCRANRIPFWATLHARGGGDKHRSRLNMRTLAALLPARLVVHNEQHRAELGFRGAAVVPHGIEAPRIIDVQEAKRESGVDPNRPVIAHFGFLVPNKGVAETIEAVAELVRGPLPRLLYRVVGGAVPTDESRDHARALSARVRELGLEDHVELAMDFVPAEQARRRLESADWIVLNYRHYTWEGTSGAARFALGAGRPLAISRSPLFDDLRGTAHTLDGPLTAALAKLFDASSHELAAQTLALSRSYADACSWPRIAERHLALFRESA
jgi:glycosyltransferase involved in cell wall biosynthesis